MKIFFFVLAVIGVALLGVVWLHAQPAVQQAPLATTSQVGRTPRTSTPNQGLIGVSSGTEAVSASSTSSTPGVIGVATANPDIVFTNSPTQVTFSCQIADSRVIPVSVMLQSVDSKGNVIKTIGVMQQSSTDPSFFTKQLSFSYSSSSTVYYRVSAGYKGILLRSASRLITIPVISLATSSWLNYSAANGLGFKYPSQWSVAEDPDGTITVSRPDLAQSIPVEGASDIVVTTESNPENLSIQQFFSGNPGPDLFTDTQSITSVQVAGITSTDFSGLSSFDSHDVVVIPVSGTFIVIYDSAPATISTLFLSTLQYQ
jgi:hypothetical protein